MRIYNSPTPAQRRKMRRLYDKGATVREIQEALDNQFCRGAIANYLHADGGHVRPRGMRHGTTYVRRPSSGGT